MAFSPINLLAMMVTVLGLNSAVVRLGLAKRVPALYWIVQGMNAATTATGHVTRAMGR